MNLFNKLKQRDKTIENNRGTVASASRTPEAAKRLPLSYLLKQVAAYLGVGALIVASATIGERLLFEPPARAAYLPFRPSLLWNGKVVPTPTPTPGQPRLERGDVEMSLFWNTRDDLDFMLRKPSGGLLSCGNPGEPGGVHLDVDMNRIDRPGLSTHPVEHFVVPTRSALEPGTYILYVHYYCKASLTSPTTLPFRVVVKDNELPASAQEHLFRGTVTCPEFTAPAVCTLTVNEQKHIAIQSADGIPPLPLHPGGK